MSFLAAPAPERLSVSQAQLCCVGEEASMARRWPLQPGADVQRPLSPSLSQPQPRSESFIYFNYFFNIPHLMMQIPLSSLSVHVLIQIFLLIVHGAAVVLN